MRVLPLAAFLAVVGLVATAAYAAKREPSGKNPIADLPQAYLDDPANIKEGQEIWLEQCQHCHGSKAYPGKAPKLNPRIYTPGFVYERVTYGFRKMPAWNEVYDENERKAVVAWVMSRKFSP